MKKALITGIAGQDGSFLTEFLLEKDYQVFGLALKEENFEHLKPFRHKITILYGDLSNKKSLERAIIQVKPDELYNLAAISFIPASWQNPTLACDVNALGVSRLLEIIRDQSLKTRFFQASSAQMFGKPEKSPQDEKTLIAPLNPYGATKAFAHFLVRSFRVQYGLFACSAIFYNHESERRPEEFVTRKITRGAAKIKLGLMKRLELGNLEAKRDWGYAPDYVRAAWLMLQQKSPEDYVIATGQLHSVKDICKIAFKSLDLNYRKYVIVKKEFFRPERGIKMVGNPTKAKRVLGWQPKVSFEAMIKKMTKYDFENLRK